MSPGYRKMQEGIEMARKLIAARRLLRPVDKYVTITRAMHAAMEEHRAAGKEHGLTYSDDGKIWLGDFELRK